MSIILKNLCLILLSVFLCVKINESFKPNLKRCERKNKNQRSLVVAESIENAVMVTNYVTFTNYLTITNTALQLKTNEFKLSPGLIVNQTTQSVVSVNIDPITKQPVESNEKLKLIAEELKSLLDEIGNKK